MDDNLQHMVCSKCGELKKPVTIRLQLYNDRPIGFCDWSCVAQYAIEVMEMTDSIRALEADFTGMLEKYGPNVTKGTNTIIE